jgi:hypothetical protein
MFVAWQSEGGQRQHLGRWIARQPGRQTAVLFFLLVPPSVKFAVSCGEALQTGGNKDCRRRREGAWCGQEREREGGRDLSSADQGRLCHTQQASRGQKRTRFVTTALGDASGRRKGSGTISPEQARASRALNPGNTATQTRLCCEARTGVVLAEAVAQETRQPCYTR